MSWNALKSLLALLCLCGMLLAAGSSSAGLWLDVPFISQESDGCGAASIAMVMQYWLKQQTQPLTADADPAQIQRALYSSKVHGIYASDLEDYFRQHGYQVFVLQGSWNDLEQQLAKGRPLIAALKPGSVNSSLHYVVVVGLVPGQTSKEDIVLLNDPAQRKLLKQDRPTFEKQWSATGNWLLLALPLARQEHNSS